MADKKPTLVAPPIGIVPQVARTDSENSGSAKMPHKSGLFTHAREGKTFDGSSSQEDFYKPIASYEGIHRYDPKFDWEPEEERKVVRKVRNTPLFTHSTFSVVTESY